MQRLSGGGHLTATGARHKLGDDRGDIMAMTIRALAAAAAIAFVATAPDAAFAKQLIVRSAGPSAHAFPPGKQIADGARIVLAAGDSLTLIGAATARQLRGPGTFVAGGEERLASLANRRSRFGAQRGPLNERGPWDVDVSSSGTVCVGGTSDVHLWRATAGDAVKLTISSAAASATLDWPAGSVRQAWPASLPITDSAPYTLKFDGSDRATSIVLALVPPQPDMAASAQGMLDRGCTKQLNLLVNDLLQRD